LIQSKRDGKKLLGDITFKIASESDIPQMVDLMNSEYLRKKNESYFLWQYFKSVYPTISMCAFKDEKLVGMFGLQKRMLNNGAVVGQAIDLIVANEWRGRGIFKRLYEKVLSYFDSLDVLCVFPNLNGKNACEKGLGWLTVGRINSMCISKKPQEAGRISVTPPNHKLCRFEYNTRIRQWRFRQHPEYEYSYIHHPSQNLVITKVFVDPINKTRIGDIVDFECDLDNPLKLSEIFVDGCLHLIKQEVEYITTWALPHTQLYGVLKSLGFTEMPQERYFCVKILNKRYECLNDIPNWHLVQADAEIY